MEADGTYYYQLMSINAYGGRHIVAAGITLPVSRLLHGLFFMSCHIFCNKLSSEYLLFAKLCMQR